MKKMMILFVALVAAWCASCSKDDDGGKTPDDPVEEAGLIMKSEEQVIRLDLFSEISKITIDWGDGTVKEYEGEYQEASNAYRIYMTYKYSQNALHTIKINECTGLLYLECRSNQLTSLNVSGCTDLLYLYCSSNQLPSLDVSGCPDLIRLDCSYNQLPSLDVSGCPDLQLLYCSSNRLPSLDVSGCPDLIYLFCDYNRLSSLDVSGCPNLTWFDCSSNQFSASALNQIYTDLPTIDGKIRANSNPGYPESDRSIATGKGWVFSE